MILYAAPIFLGAFLLFLVQPIIAKQILPWFGGSAAVWATCMVFFQMALLLGYAYADWTTRRLTHRRQVILHIALLALSLLLLPIIPDAAWKPAGNEDPAWRILGLLAVTIGLPYFLLSTTSPLMQAWFAWRFHHAAPYRLFALSNLASLLALLFYPVAIEPWVTTATQSVSWSVIYGVFALLSIATAIVSIRNAGADKADVPVAAGGRDAGAVKPGAGQQLVWLALAAMASFLLLAVTNHICQNVASLPFLWILPLSLYLATFIFCFDHPRWYRRNIFLVLAAIALPVMAWYSDSLDLKVAIPIYLAGLFVCCMFCHGELAQLKPAPRFLTTYYLMISLGGAVGGLLVGLVAPHLLTGYFELGIGLVACALLLLYRTFRIAWWTMLASAAVVGATAWGAGKAIDYQVSDSRVMMRNFYSVLRTREYTEPVPFRSMVHGGIVHGGQLLDPDMRLAPSSYFGPNSGYGRMFASLPDAPRKVGVIGLGAGSIIAYARKGDTFRFYEINPQVVELARREFTFMADNPAKTEVVLGDGRLSLEREASQQFDVLAMDAFSGDSIPLHLLTREAMAIYLQHLKPGGVLAFQATNRFIDIAPVVASLAAEHGLTAVLISDSAGSEEGADYWISGTDQILVTSNRALLESGNIRAAGKVLAAPPGFRIWTDSFNNLLRVLK
ncbi:MAG: fused MFS/spermidine synthase [Betaproteobacteria bacterium]|nr:fused MFS/spermidine synthase [Betaproteobacteria bacterium]